MDSRRVALEWYAVGSADNAASIAGMLLTTECVLCDIKEPVLWRRLSRQPPMPAGWCAPRPKWSEPRHGRHGRYVLNGNYSFN